MTAATKELTLADRVASVISRLKVLEETSPAARVRGMAHELIEDLSLIHSELADPPQAPSVAPKSHAPGPREMGSKRRCPTHDRGNGASVSASRFRPGRDVCRECERREVRVLADSISLQLIEGDRCVGHDCPACGLPFEVGGRVVGGSLHHEGCSS